MDTSDPEIVFDKDGLCNHCKLASEALARPPLSYSMDEKSKALNEVIRNIKDKGKSRNYDCIIGLSGGVDSSYVAFLVKKMGLRPLAVHLDNGWDAELAVKNIEEICKRLNIDLFTHVIDWEEFKDLQLAFLKSSTPDSEIPSDHAIVAVLYEIAIKNHIQYIIGGTNWSSESILPRAWSRGHEDWHYIKSIWKQFGKKKPRTYPHRSLFKKMTHRLHGIKWVEILDYLDYDKEKAKEVITLELGWRDYGRKHAESNYTRIYQEYVLPRKFGYDKRRAHLSSLIIAGQLERDEALKAINENLYPDKAKLQDDIRYFTTKFGISIDDFEAMMNSTPKSYEDYPNSTNTLVYRIARSLKKALAW